jgi:hypothetical protein
MLKAKGTVSVEPHKGRIVLDVSPDFVKLYKYFIETHYWIRMGSPLHGSHVTIFNQKHHTKVNWQRAMWYDKQEVEFEYDPYVIEGGYRKGFLMYYLKVFSSEIDQMKKKLGINDGEGYRGLHISVANGKFNSVFPSWPKMISIKTEI